MKPAKSCSNCRYWKPHDVSREVGQCSAPLPISMSGFLIRLKPTLSDQGKDCPAFRKRIARAKRTASVTPISSVATSHD